AEIYRVDGIVNQLAGDGMMALFGAPVAHENAPQRAVHAAIAIRDALDAFNEDRGAGGERDLSVRIGINTGPVVVGTVGNDLKMDYTAIGDTTNLAARLQSLADPGSILVSEATQRLVRGFFQLRPAGDFTVKGKSEPVATYEILGMSDAVTPMAIAEARGLTPLVGRAAELSQLRSCFDRLSGNLAQIVAMTGVAGSGKSRLLYEFKQAIANEDAVFLEARCSPLTQMVSYGPWIDMLRGYFELKRGEPCEVSCDKVAHKLEVLGLNTEQVCPYVCRSLGLPADGLGELAPEEVQRRTFHAIGALITAESRRRPAVVIIEDLQWIDEPSLETLAMMVSKLKDARVMVILSHRPDYQPTWRTHAAFTRLNLAPLDEAETREIIRSIAGGELPAELERRILVKAEGYPFFTEELMRALVDDGYLVRGNGTVELTRPVGDIQIPDTVQDLIGARLDRLGASAKRVVQVASVIGRQFCAAHVANLLSDEGIDVPGELEGLEGNGLIHRKSVLSAEEFRFGESLTQEVAYESLLHRESRKLHDRVAALLEGAAEGADAEGSALVAHHYARGESREKAVEAMLRAGNEAEAVPSYRGAIKFFRQAWELAEELLNDPDPNDSQRSWAMQAALGLVRVNVLHGLDNKRGETQAIARRGQELAEKLGAVDVVAGFYSFRGMDLMSRNRASFSEGLSLVEQAFNMLRDGDYDVAAVRAARAVGWAYMLDGRFEKSRNTLAWSMEKLEEEGGIGKFPDLYIAMSWMQAAIDFFSDDVQTAEGRMQEAYARALEAPNYTVQASTAVTLAQIHFQRAEYEKAREWANRALEISLQIGHFAPLWSASVILLSAHVETGQRGSVARYLEPLEEGMSGGTNILLSIQLIVEGLLAVGRIDKAREYAEVAAERAGGRLRESYAAIAMADVQRATGEERWEDAEANYARALALCAEIGSRSGTAIAKLGAARLAQARGDRERSASLAREAIETSREVGNVRWQRQGEALVEALSTRP
ncbi:MAG: AAA family ATPase, partial [Myxococcota bacterium]